MSEGSAGEREVAYYDRMGGGYNRTRSPDPRLARLIDEALGDAVSVVNVGAGTGAYEPSGRSVIAIEPSSAMIAARPPGAAPALQAAAEALPLPDDSVDAAMAVLTMHHWQDVRAGLAELRRVARRRVVLFTWDPQCKDALWLTTHYLPVIREHDRVAFPALTTIAAALGELQVTVVPLAHDWSDGFLGSRWRRPEEYLEARVRAGMSGFGRLGEDEVATAMARLHDDLVSGDWDRRFGALRGLDELDLGYRLVVSQLADGGSGGHSHE